MESKFLSELECKEVGDGKWMLITPLEYQSELLNKVVLVPGGFTTDFASVPRVPFVYFAYGDRAHRESTIHDRLYFLGEVTRAVADSVFLEAMKARGKKTWIRVGMYLGVRLGGWKAWGDHRKREKIK